MKPEVVLRGFIGDLYGIINWSNHPRADGYGSSGSDERRMAEEYYERVGYPFFHREFAAHACRSCVCLERSIETGCAASEWPGALGARDGQADQHVPDD